MVQTDTHSETVSLLRPDSTAFKKIWFVVPVALWALLQLGPMIWSLSPLGFHNLYGPDDYMRMVQVQAFLIAPFSSPYEMPRIGPEGVSNFTWTRLADILPALTLLFFDSFMPRARAVYAAAMAVPAIHLILLMGLTYIYVRILCKKRAAITGLIILCMIWPMMRQFMPGRVDHHALTLLFSLGAVICLMLSAKRPSCPVAPLAGGFLLALALSVAVEILPWIAVLSGLGALLWILKGHDYLRANFVFALSLCVGTIVSFYVWRYPHAGFGFACDTLSFQIALLVSAVALFWCMVFMAARKLSDVPHRLAAAVVAAVISGAVLWPAAGICVIDPYHIKSALVRDIWLNGVQEAQPWYALWHTNPQMMIQAALPFIGGVGFSLWAYKKDEEQKLFWGALLIIMLCGAVLANMQLRFGECAALLSTAPIAWGISQGWRKYCSYETKRRVMISTVFFVLCLGIFTLRFYGHSVKPEAAERINNQCSSHLIASILGVQPKGLVAAYINLGPDILFRTDHHVMAAPYHINEAGIEGVYNIFTAPDVAAAQEAVYQNKVDYLVLCPAELSYWQEVSGKEDIFAAELLAGNVPAWLSRLPELDGQKAQIFKVYQR